VERLTEIFGPNWLNVIISFATMMLAYLIGILIRSQILERFHRLAEKTSWGWDDPIFENLKRPFVTWCLIAGVYLVKMTWQDSIPPHFSLIINKVIIAALGISILIFAARTISALVGLYGDKIDLPLTGLTQSLAKVVVLILGILMILNSLGVSITPLLTTLGIGGLAVALALQDTLSNLFSGFYITMARNIRQGDFIKLESGEEGYVEDVGWRASVIRMLPNNMVIIPNSKLANSVITNYSLPVKEMSVIVQVGVHYASDLEHVEKVTIETAKRCQESIEGAVAEHVPFIRYHTFDNSSINFSVILRTSEFVGNYLLKHEFIKLLHERYREEGITIPYPIRALNFEQEKASSDPGTGLANN